MDTTQITKPDTTVSMNVIEKAVAFKARVKKTSNSPSDHPKAKNSIPTAVHGFCQSKKVTKNMKREQDRSKTPEMGVTEKPCDRRCVSPAIIKAFGEAVEKILRVAIPGAGLLALVFGGLWIWCVKPDSAKDLWGIIGPIISGAIAFRLGKNSK